MWDSVRSPDPVFTKSYTSPSGFEGTTINATYLVRRATELWGPAGKAWRHKVVSERFVDAAPILGRKAVIGKKAVLDKSGALQGHQDGIVGHEDFVIGHEVVCHFAGQLTYPGGVLDTVGSWPFVSANELGTVTDAEAPIKARTRALSKALSHLGFGADIFMGMWDDNDPPPAPAQAPKAPKTRAKPAAKSIGAGELPADGDWYAPLRAQITGAATVADLQTAWKTAQKEAKKRGDTLAYGLLKSANDSAAMRLSKPAAKA